MICLADAFGVAFIGLVIIYLYWKKERLRWLQLYWKREIWWNEKRMFCDFPCINGFPNNDSEVESEKGGGGGASGGEGDLVAIDKGFIFELDELLRASAYVLGKSGLGIVYKVVLGNGIQWQ